MIAAILSIGDELILGQALDTNGRWLSARLVEGGVVPEEHRTVADDRRSIAHAITELARGRDLVLLTGGLGPTEDDLTRVALGDVVDPGAELVEDERARLRLERWFKGRRAPMPVRNLVQALRPPSARCIDNPHGTAPGLDAVLGGCRLVAMPGPPREMQPMFDRAIAPTLDSNPHIVSTGLVRLFGLGESDAAARLGDLMARDRDPLVGTTASAGLLSARIRTEHRGLDDDPDARLEASMRAVEEAWAPYAFGRGDDTLAAALLQRLRERHASVATAESCTGGWLGKLLVDESGASDVYRGGWVTYSNALKTKCLGVPESLITEHGAVSAAVARAMADGARIHANASFGLATTGLAGPEGGSAEKPVGTVFVGLAGDARPAIARRFRFRGDRAAIRSGTALAALQMLRLHLLDEDDSPLLWEDADPGASR